VTFKTDEIIKIRIGEKLTRNYRGFNGTFATLAYNSIEKKALPGLHDSDLVVGAEQEKKTLSLTLSGHRTEDALMDMMDIALRNASAFPAEAGRAHFSITIKQGSTP